MNGYERVTGYGAADYVYARRVDGACRGVMVRTPDEKLTYFSNELLSALAKFAKQSTRRVKS